MATPKKRVCVHVVSDATGITAERVISAVLVQFRSEVEPVIKRHAFVRTTDKLGAILDRVEQNGGLVIYSLVSRRLRGWMTRERRRRGVKVIDLLGPLLRRMERLLGVMPQLHPGLLSAIDRRSLQLAESIDFTLQHDDGQGLDTLGRADIIIVGVSRTSKTPTSLYLSCNHNLKVANIPIVLGVEPPAKLFTLKRPRKFGFTIDAEKLADIRQRRYRGRVMPDYNELPAIRRELAYCQRVFDRIDDIKLVDVTHSPIEEVANHIA